jgi:hypothetical protein
MENPNQTDQITTFLLEILRHQADEKAMDWLLLQKDKIHADPSDMKFFPAFSQASRYFKKTPLRLSEEQKTKAEQFIDGFQPESWDHLQTARSILMLHYPSEDSSNWLANFHKLFETADMHEQTSLYAALPIMPFPEAMVPRAVEGLRTNITSVFDAIALNNPYPSKYLSESAWNQMVIKAIFLQRPLYKIHNADINANADLADILLDFAHERWAAGRTVMPELWRFVRHYLDEQKLNDLEKVIDEGNPLERNAALLACNSSGLIPAQQLLDRNPEIKKDIESGRINWEYIGREFENRTNN